MTERKIALFWRISAEARAKLMQYQWRHYGTKLDIASHKPPWEEKPPPPEIPVETDMTPEEMQDFIAEPPQHQEKLD